MSVYIFMYRKQVLKKSLSQIAQKIDLALLVGDGCSVGTSDLICERACDSVVTAMICECLVSFYEICVHSRFALH